MGAVVGPSPGALLQFLLQGPEDFNLFLNPQVSLFGCGSSLLMKPPDVQMTPVEDSFDSSPSPAFYDLESPAIPKHTVSKCKLSKIGSVIGNCHLEIILPATFDTMEPITYVPNCMLRGIEYVAITIAGLEIERFSSQMLECYFKYFDPKLAGNSGAFDDIFNGHATPLGRLFTIPLPFFFSRHILGPKLPVAALISMDISISLSLGNARDIMLPKADGSYPVAMSPVSAKIVAERFELPASDLASTFFTSAQQSQLIMQIRSQQIDVNHDSKGNQSIILNFNQPARRLVWFVANPQGNIMQRPFAACSLMLNNIDVLSRGPPSQDGSDGNDESYFRLVSPNLYGGVYGSQNGLHQYSFCLQNHYDISGPGMFAKRKPLLYPIKPSWNPEKDGPYMLSEQPNGSFDLGLTTNYLKLRFKTPFPLQGSVVHVIAECYNLFQFSNGKFSLDHI